MKLRTIALSTLAAFSVIILSPLSVLAAAAALYLSPASGTVSVGSIIPVQVRVNSGTDPVNAIQANLTYNASQLAYQSIDTAGSAFSLTANVQATSGSLKMARATGGGEPPAKGDLLFVTVYFKALTTAGTASVAVAADSHVVRSTDSVDIMAGAPAATGTKASATGAPKAKAYVSLPQAQAAVAALATPTPAVTATPEVSAAGVAAGTTTPTPSRTSSKVLAWNNPVTLGGIALLVFGMGALAYYLSRRGQPAHAIDSSVGAVTQDNPAYQVNPIKAAENANHHGTYRPETGEIDPERVYPSAEAVAEAEQKSEQDN